jgi:hypothetical protein
MAGIGETNSGSDHPNPTQPQSHPAITPLTDLFPRQPGASNPNRSHPDHSQCVPRNALARHSLDQELAEVKESTLWSGRSSPDDEASQVQTNGDLRSWVDPCTNAPPTAH